MRLANAESAVLVMQAVLTYRPSAVSCASQLRSEMRISLACFEAVASQTRRVAAASSISSLLASRTSRHGSISDEVVQINGWIRSIRSLKHVSFIDLNDGSDHTGLQAVLPGSVLKECDERTRTGLSTGASIRLQGQLVPKKGGNQQGHELNVQHIDLVGACDGAVSLVILLLYAKS